MLEDLVPNIRNAVRAVIVANGSILMQQKWSAQRGYWYTLPGGGQEVQETLTEALLRECEEELGTRVVIDDLLHVADFYKLREAEFPSTRHLVEFLFACSLPEDYRPGNGGHPDKHQVDVVWLPLTELSDYRLFPPGLSACLAGLQDGSQKRYLGTLD